ncbi:hypothetical protein BPOR_0608g00030 [Botrytis porri]|uniref:Uncharacterized protein n=1 Tax=Botrytis porri TaxID=87229 RepID=A0A4Z1KDF2_9HELO|nr:hypothetical protein BPOR_0608g00030 [Botrytis porri]
MPKVMSRVISLCQLDDAMRFDCCTICTPGNEIEPTSAAPIPKTIITKMSIATFQATTSSAVKRGTSLSEFRIIFLGTNTIKLQMIVSGPLSMYSHKTLFSRIWYEY